MECNESSAWNWRDPNWPIHEEWREKVPPISVRVKGRKARRESEGVILPEDEDSKTSSSLEG